MRRIDAVFEIFLNIRIVKTIAIHKTRIMINPSKGDFNPKNAIDQKKLRINWVANTIKDLFTFLWVLRFFKTRYNEIPIIVYNKVQTGANTQLGGLKNGFARDAYQVGMFGAVDIAPITPAS